MTQKGEHVDFRALNELKQIMGDEFGLLIETFFKDSVVRIELINDAVAAGEPDTIRITAHSFKGSASNMGAPLLADLCRQLEDLGSSESIDNSRAIADQIHQEFILVQNALLQF